MSYLVICAVALLASALTFFSGFGLGTLLLPAFAFFVPVEQAVALVAIVHLLNNLFKLALTVRHADFRIVLRFGLPAIVMAFAGAGLLVWLAGIAPVYSYTLFGKALAVTPVNLAVGVLLLLFTLLEFLPKFRALAFGAQYMPLGGMLSGFFGGLSGMQGALRSAFLSRAGLTKEAFIGTGVVVACLIDIARLAIYSSALSYASVRVNFGLLAAAVAAAFLGAVLGNHYLKKMTMPGIQSMVAVMLLLVAAGLISGML